MNYEYFKCPITLQYFRNPTTLSDGITYEYKEITKWLEEHNYSSPLTKKNIDKNYSVNIVIKNVIDELEKNGSIQERYMNYKINIEKFKLNKFKSLKTIEQQKKYLDDVDLECEDENGNKPIHLICQNENSTSEIIKYIIDKDVDLECEDINGWRPIHLICQYSTPEIIKYIIDKGVNLECENDEKWRPIHFICKYSTPEIIKYIIDKGVDLECENKDRNKPIYYIDENENLTIEMKNELKQLFN